jgi:ribosomal protein S12 methylthiotransferase accessory factor
LIRPRFKPGFHVVPIAPSQVILLTETRSFALEGAAYFHLAPLLTGSLTVDQVLDAVSAHVPIADVFYALRRLEVLGHVEESSETDRPRSERAFWHLYGTDAARAHERLAHATVSVSTTGLRSPAAADALTRALAECGIRAAESETTCSDLAIVLADDYLDPELETWNRRGLAAGQPWMLAKPAGHMLWVGPIFRPGHDDAPCWACLAERIRANRQIETYLDRKARRSVPLQSPRGTVPATLSLGASLAALEAAKWIADPTLSVMRQTLLTFDLPSLEARRHHVVRRPQCPVCGDPEIARRPRRVRLQPVRKVFDEDGGFRSSTPGETFARIAHHISPISGVVSALEPLMREAGVAFSYWAGRNFAMMGDQLFFMRQNVRGLSGGKGTTELQAKVSALCEAIERYSGIWRGDEPATRTTAARLGDKAIDPNTCMLFSEAQYAGRREWNHGQPLTRYHYVTEPFDREREIDWVEIQSLTNDRTRYIPSAYCYYGHRDIWEYLFCLADANGTSAGNTIEEAVLQGFLELVERDATAIWWYNRVRRPAVDLASFGLPYVAALEDYYARIQRELWVLDLTTDLGIPVFAAVSRRTDHPVEDIILGLGAHLDPRLALLRALTELNQFLPTVSGRRPDGSAIYMFNEMDAITWWQTATLQRDPYVTPSADLPARRASHYRSLGSDDLKTDVERCVSIARAAGVEVFVLDQTRPDIDGLHVAKVLAPGLRHFWRRLGRGRLYDVPVQLGWLTEPTPEAALNPLSIFF